MASPLFSKLNGQIKTAWRWYDAIHKLAENHPSCRQEGDICDPPCVLSAGGNLPPFQFARPTTIQGITSWRLYDAAGVEVANLDANIPLLDIVRFVSYDYVIYGGAPLAAVLDPGLYYSRIITNGSTYYSEPVKVVCSPEAEDCFYADWRQTEYQNEAAPGNYWRPYFGLSERLLDRILAIAGPPTNPAWEIPGFKVANTADGLLYTRNIGNTAWVSSTPATGWWFLNDGGFWWAYDGAAWVGGVGTPNGVFSSGLQFYGGTTYGGVGLEVNAGNVGCSCNDSGPIRVEVTVVDMTAGTLTVQLENDDAEVISANGTSSFLSYVANGYMLKFTPSNDFDGLVTEIKFFCQLEASTCYRRLAWTNCGNVGNTYFEEGFMDSMWLDTFVHPMLPVPSNRIESEEQADGTVVETFRRKEVRYSMRLGLVPWPVADALSELPLMDTVRLYHTNNDGYDTLRDVRVDVNYDESVSECMPQVEVSFAIDNTAVACCDEFQRPCLVPCVDAEGFAADVGLSSTGAFLDENVCRYINYEAGEETGRVECPSGSANVKVDEVEAIPKADNLQTYLWDPALVAWVALGVVDTVTSETVGGECHVIVQATLLTGYSGQLQYYNGIEWFDADFPVLTAAEWLNNVDIWVKQSGAQFVRLKVLRDTCEAGFTAAWPTNVSCA